MYCATQVCSCAGLEGWLEPPEDPEFPDGLEPPELPEEPEPPDGRLELLPEDPVLLPPDGLEELPLLPEAAPLPEDVLPLDAEPPALPVAVVLFPVAAFPDVEGATEFPDTPVVAAGRSPVL